MSNFDDLLLESQLEEMEAAGNKPVDLASLVVEGVEDILDEDEFAGYRPEFDPTIDQYQRFNQTYVNMDSDELESMYNPERSTELNNYGNHVSESSYDDGRDYFKPKYASSIIPVEEVIFEESNLDDEDEENAILSGLSSGDEYDDDEDLYEGK